MESTGVRPLQAMNRFTRARRAAGFRTIYQAARAMNGVSRQTLSNLEKDPRHGSRVLASTMMEIVRVYYPYVDVVDFFGRKAQSFTLVATRDFKGERAA